MRLPPFDCPLQLTGGRQLLLAMLFSPVVVACLSLLCVCESASADSEREAARKQFWKGFREFRPRLLSNDGGKNALLELESPAKFSDQDMVHLRHLPRMGYVLETLILRASPIDGSGLIHLECLPELKVLDLSDTRVTDCALKHLTRLKHLERLGLEHTPVTDKGLRYLEKLDTLRGIWLHSAQITDRGLSHLVKLKRVEILDLSKTKITDAGLEQLLRLPKLEILHLGGTEITDKGIPHLQKLKRLEQLTLFKSKCTLNGIADLRRALPKCRILSTRPDAKSENQ